MIVLLHVVIACTSLVYTSYLFFVPSRRKLYVSYSLTAATLLSGTYLVISTKAAMLQACTTGLIYLGITSLGIIGARHKLASQEVSNPHTPKF